MTPFIKKKETKNDWYVINAQNAAVGRLAAYISKVLRGKNKARYNPHIDNGDFAIEANDVSAIQLASESKVPFVVTPVCISFSLNILTRFPNSL